MQLKNGSRLALRLAEVTLIVESNYAKVNRIEIWRRTSTTIREMEHAASRYRRFAQ